MAPFFKTRPDILASCSRTSGVKVQRELLSELDVSVPTYLISPSFLFKDVSPCCKSQFSYALLLLYFYYNLGASSRLSNDYEHGRKSLRRNEWGVTGSKGARI